MPDRWSARFGLPSATEDRIVSLPHRHKGLQEPRYGRMCRFRLRQHGQNGLSLRRAAGRQ